MSIQMSVLTIASVLLVLVLGLIGYAIYSSKSTANFPPEISECPDYWKVVGVNKCENVMNLGTCHGIHDFSAPEWKGNAGLQKKNEWAKGCGIVWDSITNNTRLNN